MGYSPLEIDPEVTISGWQRPDRTILPGTDYEWFLEAKAWGVSLDDEKHLQQATSYANNRGRRWVVLTNGQVWRIYDDFLTGVPPADRLVAEARLDRAVDLEQLLSAISRDAMVSGALGRFATRTRLSAVLTRSLKDENSDAIRALWNLVRREPGLSEVARRDVAAYFNDLQAAIQPEVTRPTLEPKRPYLLVDPIKAPTSTPAPIEPGSIDLETLARNAQTRATGLKPEVLVCPDGSTTDVATWRDVAVAVLGWLSANGGLPELPFRGGQRGNRYFLNVSPNHSHGPMQEGYRAIDPSGNTYVDLHRSAADLLGRLADVCQEVRVPAKHFHIRVASQP
jgi:hypothetical protein